MNNSIRIAVLATAFIGIFAVKASAQHCAFDGTEIVVINVVSKGGNTVIPNLKITVLDSTGNTAMTELWANNHWINDTLKFWQNTKKQGYSIYSKTEYMNRLTYAYFWFAENNYVLADGIPIGIQIRIEDTDGKKNGGYFKTKVVALPKQYIYPLCSHFSSWSWGKESGFVKGYKSLKIKLDKQE